MKKVTTALTCTVLAAALTGCATLDSAPRLRSDSPKYYTGTRLNTAALRGDDETLYYFRLHDMHPARHPAIDLPLSFMLDTLLLPFIFNCSLQLTFHMGCYDPEPSMLPVEF